MSLSQETFPSEVITMDEKSNNTKLLKRSVKSYATKIFQESTIGIVASIASTHSPVRRVFKSLVLMLCISGFLYQCITFLIHVFQYPTTVDVDIQKPHSYDMPAYTFCNNNGIKRSIYCEKYPERCYEPPKKFCSKFHNYCGKNSTQIPKKEFYQLEATLSHEEILTLGDDLKDFLLDNDNEFDEEITGPYMRSKDLQKGSMTCYSLHSVVNLPKHSHRKNHTNDNPFEQEVANTFKFYVREDEMFIPGNRPGVLFSIHSPYEAVNPFNKGIFLKPGRNYRIYVTMEQEVLLKQPFPTDCINYHDIWEANNRSGPRVQEMCQHKCILDLSLHCFNCVAPIILYPSDARICDFSDYNQTCPSEEIETMVKCLGTCKDDCKYTKYTTEVMERYEVDFEDDENMDNYDRLITVEIILEAAEIITLRHSPKYMSVEVFSSIGGFIGCWLGISLMDIIDVFASFFSVSRYSLKKYGKQ